jgi:ketosteroid isomerase-like protein
MSDPKTLIRQLVESFGDPDATIALVHEDATWHVFTGTSTPLTGAHNGKDAIEKLHRTVFGEMYDVSTLDVEIHSVTGDGDQAALRFTLNAKMTWGPEYHIDYAIFIKARDGKVEEAWEYLDSLAASEQVARG